MLGAEGAAEAVGWCQAWEGERRGGGEGSWGRTVGPRRPAHHGPCNLQEEAKAKEEEGVPDEEGWVKVSPPGRRPVLPRTEAASLRVLERERRKRARARSSSTSTPGSTARPRWSVRRPGPVSPLPGCSGRGLVAALRPQLRELPGLLSWERGPGISQQPQSLLFPSPRGVLEVEG